MGFPYFAPEGERIFFSQFIHHFVRQDGELLICLGVKQHFDALCFESASDFHCQIIGMFCHFEIQTVFEQCFKLDAQQSAFCQHTAALFDQVTEVFFQRRIDDHNCFPHHRAYFCTADIEDICQICDILQVMVTAFCHQRITDSCTVNKQRQFTFAACFADCFQFCQCVCCTVFRGLRNINHTRLRDMFMCRIVPVGIIAILDGFCCQFAVRCCRQNDNLMACCFDRACFMGIQVACIRTEYPLMRAQNRRDHSHICLCTAHQKMHICIFSADNFFDQRSCSVAVGVNTVACSLFHICFHQSVQNSGMHAFCIVTFKTNHFLFLLFFEGFTLKLPAGK